MVRGRMYLGVGLTSSTTYYWYVNSSDGTAENKSDIWNFTTSVTPTLILNDTYGEISGANPYTNEDLRFKCNMY